MTKSKNNDSALNLGRWMLRTLLFMPELLLIVVVLGVIFELLLT